MTGSSASGRVFNPALVPIALTAALITVLAILAPDATTAAARAFSARFMARWDVAYLYLFSILLLAVFLIALSPLGRTRIGGADAVAEFSRTTWIGMIFSGAMGGNLIGFSVYHPLQLLEYARLLYGAGPGDQANANALAIYLWGFHGWGPWSLLAVAFAYASYNRGGAFGFKGITDVIVPAQYPRSRTLLAGVSDYTGVIACWLGVSVGISLISQQVAGGLIDNFQLSAATVSLAPAISIAMTIVFVVVAMTGLSSGIARISRYNFILAHLFLAAVFLLCNPLALVTELVATLINYGKILFTLPFLITDTTDEAIKEFRLIGPTSYLLWWLGVSTLIGLYYARISYGRSIREVLLVITIVPTALMAIWFGIMGSAAARVFEQSPALLDNLSASQTVYTFVAELPLGGALASVALLLSILFLVTTGAPILYVLAEFMYESVTTPSRGTILLWGIALGTTVTVLSAQSSITAMQELAVSVSIPFSLLYFALTIAFLGSAALYRFRANANNAP
jgi:choline-glycine betaine transporter